MLVCAIALVVLGSAMPAVGEQLSDRERSAPTQWAWYYGVSPATLGSTIAEGYRIIDLEVDSAAPLLFNAVLVRNSGEYGKGPP